jgi:SRSO17 transposase
VIQRVEQEDHMVLYVERLKSGMERKSIEPIATAHSLYRRPLQYSVGAWAWPDTLRTEMRRHVVEELGDPARLFVLDGSGVKKQGSQSVGVARQYCGRLGKIDKC